ncbi:MAG: aldehyde dehydrogenase family protein [Alphaproteobacteria bacterium]|nr:MAG: aldehyde dehydrogenase family protein [Alphaproteobacteria bacterium]
MDAAIRNLVDISHTLAARRARAELMLERARWAAEVFRRYDRDTTQAIAAAVARVAFDKAGEYAEWAVKETGFGVAAHKKIKNELSSVPLVEHYRDWDFVNPRIDEVAKIVEVPRPAGVVFALVPSTNPIATVYFKVLSALMTRNAVVMSPHPAARECCVDAARTLARAAEKAGAPEAVVQVVEQPDIPLIEEFMRSEKTDVILATGGTAMVRAAYSSTNPAIGVGPGNAPVFVDGSANLKLAAQRIVESKSFDNSILCTNESVLITLADIAKQLRRELERAGAYVCSGDERDALRRYLFHERGFNVEAIGRDATWIAAQAGLRVPPKTRILVTPIDLIGVDEPLSKEKLCPVLGLYVAHGRAQAFSQARAMLRMAGAGHSAAIHANETQVIMDYSAAVEVYRVVVNAPCSQGAAGFATNLSPSFTIGTGFFGRSSVGENIGPQHLVNWTRIAYHKDPGEVMGDFSATRLRFAGPLPEAPADGVPGSSRAPAGRPPVSAARRAPGDGTGGTIISGAELREEIRRIIIEELRAALKE